MSKIGIPDEWEREGFTSEEAAILRDMVARMGGSIATPHELYRAIHPEQVTTIDAARLHEMLTRLVIARPVATARGDGDVER